MLVKEDTKHISVHKLKEWNKLYCDNLDTICKQGVMSWTITRNGIEEVTSAISFQINYEKSVAHSLTLSYLIKSTGENINQYINLELTKCTYGGCRFWFSCPECKQRSAKLYFAHSKYVCRKCANLTYESNNRSKRERGWDNIFNMLPNFSADPTPLDKLIRKAERYPTYKGVTTKAYDKAMRMIQSIPPSEEIDRLLRKNL